MGVEEKMGCGGKAAVQYYAAPELYFFGTRLSAAPQNRLILRAFSKVQEGLRILVHPLSH